MESLVQFSTTEDLFVNQNSKQINLNTRVDGTYYIANNGYLIHSISNSPKIGKTNLSNGNLEEELDLGNVGFRNIFHFKWGGNTDIALFTDAETKRIFVMYQIKNENTATLNELKCFPKLELGKSWKLPLVKYSIGFCMINDLILYIGQTYSAPKFDKIFNLVDNSYKDIDLNFKFSKYITHISYIPLEHPLIIGDYYNFYRCYAEYN